MSRRTISIENYLYKMNTSIRRTLLLIFRGACLKRFYGMSTGSNISYHDNTGNGQKVLSKCVAKILVWVSFFLEIIISIWYKERLVRFFVIEYQFFYNFLTELFMDSI